MAYYTEEKNLDDKETLVCHKLLLATKSSLVPSTCVPFGLRRGNVACFGLHVLSKLGLEIRVRMQQPLARFQNLFSVITVILLYIYIYIYLPVTDWAKGEAKYVGGPKLT